jgi:DNA-binding IclR family transcriptional regulator
MTHVNAADSASQEQTGDLLSLAEIAHHLRWHASTVRRHMRHGTLPSWALVRLPHKGRRSRYRIKREWLEQMVAGTHVGQ